ncbi:MAG: nucleotidyltransferase family protein [Parvibaculaceae bacterium]
MTRAMLLAAGLGVRMRPLTLTRPKPLVTVNGKALIDYAHDKLGPAGCDHAVVNVHYLAEQIEAWAKQKTAPRVSVSDERAALLDTGGGVVKALPLLGGEPFFVLNCDSFWIDRSRPALSALLDRWDDARMDCLLLLAPVAETVGYEGCGDFFIDESGRLSRRRGEAAGLVYIGGYLVHPRIFAGALDGKFSMNLLWDKAIAEGRLYGLVHDGTWFHVGTPDAIGEAERRLEG